jgi:hypothetical protein
VPEPALQILLQMNPPEVRYHAPNDYEFLPPSYALLNQHMVGQQIVAVP